MISNSILLQTGGLNPMYMIVLMIVVFYFFMILPQVRRNKTQKKFREELAARNIPQFLKRLDASGWQHAMIKDSFIKFVGTELVGPDWFKPTAEDILAVAAAMG